MEIRTPRLVLRELRLEDAEAANLYESDPEVVRYASHGVRTLAESRAYIERGLADPTAEPRTVFDFAVTAGGLYVGRAGFKVTDTESKQGMLWWVLGPAHQGRGYATEAMAAVIELAFGEVGLHRVYADIDPRNAPSLRVAERLGMRREGHLVESLWLKGEWVDSVFFGLLDREHRARKGAA